MPSTPRSPVSRRLAVVLAVAVAAPALGAPTAIAAPQRDSGPANNGAQPAGGAVRDSGPANNARVVRIPARVPDLPVADLRGLLDRPAPATVQTVDTGFDWAAAGVGAGVAAAFGVIALAGAQGRTRGGAHLAG